MNMDVKSILISKDLHDKLIELKKEQGVQIKHVVENSIKMYLAKINRKKEEEK